MEVNYKSVIKQFGEMDVINNIINK